MSLKTALKNTHLKYLATSQTVVRNLSGTKLVTVGVEPIFSFDHLEILNYTAFESQMFYV